MSEEKKLTPKEKIFVSEYLKDFNGSRAAVEAGYSKKSCKEIACENLTKPHIKDEINKQVNAILADNKSLALKVVRECEKIAFSKITDFLDYSDSGVILKDSKEIDSSALESISFDESFSQNGQSIKKRIKQYDKLKALEILAKYTELYKENPDIKVTPIIYLDKQDENL